jgi:type II secretory pathway pseudopilin PulG
MHRASHRGASRSASTLLEVLVALLIVAMTATSVASMASGAVRAAERMRAADGEMRRASAFLDVVALWPREDLDRHLGDREQGVWRLRIGRPTSLVYTALLLDSAGRRPLLATAMYRPDSIPPTESDVAAH